VLISVSLFSDESLVSALPLTWPVLIINSWEIRLLMMYLISLIWIF